MGGVSLTLPLLSEWLSPKSAFPTSLPHIPWWHSANSQDHLVLRAEHQLQGGAGRRGGPWMRRKPGHAAAFGVWADFQGSAPKQIQKSTCHHYEHVITHLRPSALLTGLWCPWRTLFIGPGTTHDALRDSRLWQTFIALPSAFAPQSAARVTGGFSPPRLPGTF